MKVLFFHTTIGLVQGDITTVAADAIVNAANSALRGGGGVDGAIHRAGGPAIMAECRKIGGCPTGSAVVTTAGRLPARHVIHAVGPIWQGGGHRERELLGSAYHASLQRADDLELKTIAFPSLSTGAYGFPIREAAPIALRAAIHHIEVGTGLAEITWVLFSSADYQIYVEALAQLTQSGDDFRRVD